MRRHIIAVGLAGLLTFNATATPLSAADLGMPLKAPPIVAPVEEVGYWPIVIAALIAAGIGVCIAECSHQECHSPPC